MSDQVDATNKVLREAGVLNPPPPSHGGQSANAGNPAEKPKIRLPGRDRFLGDFAKDVGAVMCGNGMYLRGEVPMYLRREKSGQYNLVEMSQRAFRTYADRHIKFVYYIAQGNDLPPREVGVSMSRDVASDTLASPDFLDQQREVRRVNGVRMPVMRSDGRIELATTGYDREAGILTMPSGIEYDELMTVDEARELFLDYFGEFDFADKDEKTGMSRSLAVHLAGFLTPFCLGLLSPLGLVPMFIYTANTRRGGKTILVKSILYALFGSAATASYGRDEEELRKVLDAEALSASSFIFFDNVKRPITSAFLEAFVTSPTWKGRVMSTQKIFTVDKQTIIYVTSNHVETSPDIAGRSLAAELFVETTDVQSRNFRRELDDSLLKKDSTRSSLLSALWAIVRHWDEQGRPKGPRKLVSFEEWSRMIGGMVIAAGFPDPLEPPKLVGGDVEGRDMQQLVSSLAEKIDKEESKYECEFDEVVALILKHDLFVDKVDGKWVHPKDGPEFFELKQPSRIKLGTLLGHYIGRTFPVEGVGTVRFGRRGSKNWRRFGVEKV